MAAVDKDLNHLDATMQLAARALLDAQDLVVVETRRSYQRQTEMLKTGKSKTLHSRHLVGMAIDTMPKGGYSAWKDKEWNAAHDAWDAIVIAMGRQPEKRIPADLGHFGMLD